MPSMKMQTMETTAALMTAAFGLIVALVWNEIIRKLIDQFFSASDALMVLFVYAILVTIIAAVTGFLIAGMLAKLKAAEAKSE